VQKSQLFMRRRLLEYFSKVPAQEGANIQQPENFLQEYSYFTLVFHIYFGVNNLRRKKEGRKFSKQAIAGNTR
jgi:hypothetical protein